MENEKHCYKNLFMKLPTSKVYYVLRETLLTIKQLDLRNNIYNTLTINEFSFLKERPKFP